ncbi:hypothetical protein [Methylobacterium sp. Leaf85]|uniref:hypothetical protein n=1 Tax=Methylobacterium sp. Leaf85 TaxID=1736241 RepID=UPI000701F9E4|nr:hypothetical protein [Methylobacterium sp. Leaf85]KQO42526.1 hypothetical protein ASF08_13090 [Methylobacterium sp. Leaf85]
MLLTLYPYLCALRLDGHPVGMGGRLDVIDDRADGTGVRSSGGGLGEPSASVIVDLNALALERTSGARGESVALVLPIVFTEDMELQETTMEAIFALMEHELDERLLRARNDPERKQYLATLRDDLRSKVGVAWTYSRKIGAEALPNDALDYSDFVEKRADLSRKAYTKVITWRRFLDRYLDVLGHQVLVLLFDDSDLNPAIAEDLVRTIRMYLSHPRVVSIVAVDLETLRRTLLARSVVHHEIVRLPSTMIQDSDLDILKEETVVQEHENTAQLLGKVLPRPNRHRLAMEDLRHLDHFFIDQRSDRGGGGKADEDRFGAFCRNRFGEASDQVDRLAWWLLHGPYRRMVAGDLRGIVSFRRQVEVDAYSPLQAIFNRHGLSDLFESTDGSLDILGRMVEGNEFESATPEQNLSGLETSFIDLCLDARMAAAGLASGPIGIVASWLPTSDLAGEVRELTDEGRVFGVSSFLRGNLAPRNCLYLHQFRHIEPVLEDLLPDPSPFVGWLAGAGLDGTAATSVREAALRLLDRIAEGGDAKLALRQPLFGVRNQLRGVKITATLAGAEAVFEQTAGEALTAILVASSVRTFRSRGGSQANASIRKALEAIVEGANGDPEGGSGFLQRLSSSLGRHERLRQEALVTWACANEIVALGDDMTRLKTRRAPRALISSMASPNPVGSQPRFPALVRATVERAEGKGDRHRLLHAWSLLPLIDVVFNFGADYLRGPSPRRSWEDIATLLETAAARFTNDRPTKRADGWIFPDLPDEVVSELATEVEQGAASLRNDLSSGDPAGTLTGESGDDALWALTPAKRLAYLLGTSETWAERNLLATPGTRL